MTTPIRILIADDHEVYREGLKRAISSNSAMVVAGEADNGHEALRLVRDNNYDLVVLDISMPGKDGLETLAEIKEIKPLLPVMILSMHQELRHVVCAFKNGASGYMTKDGSCDDFLTVVDKVIQGKHYISQPLAEMLLDGEGREQQLLRHNVLSNREYQVLCMIASGKPVSMVAAELSLSVKTVNTHRSHILSKMKMACNAELTRYAIENHLL